MSNSEGPRRVAIITGAGGTGCGRAIAVRFAARSAAVVVCDVNEAGGLETVRMIERAGERLNKEIKRRSNVVGIFPNVRATIRLVGAVLLNGPAGRMNRSEQVRLERSRPLIQSARLMSPLVGRDGQTFNNRLAPSRTDSTVLRCPQ